MKNQKSSLSLLSKLFDDLQNHKITESSQISNDFNIYPNPALNYFTIEYTLLEAFVNAQFIIRDERGKIVYEERIKNQKDQLLIPTKNFVSGVYICNLNINGIPIGSKKLTIIN